VQESLDYPVSRLQGLMMNALNGIRERNVTIC